MENQYSNDRLISKKRNLLLSNEFTKAAKLKEAPPVSLWKAGPLLHNPEDQLEKTDAYTRMFAETTYLQQARKFEVDRYGARVYDIPSLHLARGYDLESHNGNGVSILFKSEKGLKICCRLQLMH